MSNELKLIEDAAHNTLLEFLSGLAYVVAGLVVVRKEGAGLTIEADPYNWVGVAVTPLDDELELLGQMCQNYESVVGKPDHSWSGTTSHLSAALQASEIYKLKKHLLDLGLEYAGAGFVVRLSAEAFAKSPFSWADDEETVFTAVGSYAGRLHSCGAVSLTVYI